MTRRVPAALLAAFAALVAAAVAAVAAMLSASRNAEVQPDFDEEEQ